MNHIFEDQRRGSYNCTVQRPLSRLPCVGQVLWRNLLGIEDKISFYKSRPLYSWGAKVTSIRLNQTFLSHVPNNFPNFHDGLVLVNNRRVSQNSCEFNGSCTAKANLSRMQGRIVRAPSQSDSCGIRGRNPHRYSYSAAYSGGTTLPMNLCCLQLSRSTWLAQICDCHNLVHEHVSLISKLKASSEMA